MNIQTDIKTIVGLALAGLIVIALSFGIARWTSPTHTEIRTVGKEERIDSLTTALQATRTNRDRLVDSLRETKHLTDKFRQELAEADGIIAQYQEMTGSLKLARDSLEERVEQMAVANDLIIPQSNNSYGFRDTTLTHHATWGNELIGSKAFTHFRNDTIYMEQDIKQLRPVKINQALIVSKDQREVRSIVTSPDFKDLQVKSYSELQPIREDTFPWKWVFMGIGFSAGVYVAK